MALTLKQQIDADSAGVFLQTDEFAEPLTHYPAGDRSAGEPVSGVFDLDDEETGGIGSGEGARFDTENGVELRRAARVELPASVSVAETSGTTASPSLLKRADGSLWSVVRVLARDEALQLVLVTRIDRIATRKVRR